MPELPSSVDPQASENAGHRRLVLTAEAIIIGGSMLLSFVGFIDPNQFIVSVVSTLICLVSLTSFWTVHAHSALARRIAISMLPGAFLGLWVFMMRLPPQKQILGYIAVTLFLPIVSIPGFGLRAVGFRLVRLVAEPKPSPLDIDRRPVQFSVRQLMALGVAISGIALLGRLVVGDGSLNQDAQAALAIAAVFAFSNAAIALAALSSRHAVRTIIVVALASALTVLAIGKTLGTPEFQATICCELSAMNALLTGAVLLLLRRQGYRLLRLRERQVGTAGAVPVTVEST